MSSATLQRPAAPRQGDVAPARVALLGLAAGSSAAAAGVLVTVGLSLVLWAVTPSVTDPVGLMRAGVTAFAAGNGADVTIGGAVLTLSPLLLGLFGGFLLWQAVVRTPRPPAGPARQGLLAVTAGLAYGAVVLVSVMILGAPDAVVPGSLWTPFVLALLVAFAAVLRLSGDTRARWTAELADHWVVGLRLARIGTLAVIGMGSLSLAVGLILSFGQAVTLAGASVGSGVGDGLGLLLLGLAYLPNVIVGGIGYATGAGVQVGGASFSPLGSTVADLPALPLLAALPDSDGSTIGLLALLLPLLIGGLLGWAAAARLGDLRSRCLAVGSAAAVLGLGAAVAAVLASGGVSGGRWAETGVPAWAVGLLLTAELAVAGGLVALLVPRAAVAGEPAPTLRERRKAARAARIETAGDSDGSAESSVEDSDSSAESDSAQSDSAQSDSTQTDSAQSDSAQSDSAQTDSAESDSAQSDSAESNPAEDQAESDQAESDQAESDGAESVVAVRSAQSGSDSAGSDTAGSDSAVSDSAGSEEAGSEKAGSDVERVAAAGTEAAGHGAAEREEAVFTTVDHGTHPEDPEDATTPSTDHGADDDRPADRG